MAFPEEKIPKTQTTCRDSRTCGWWTFDITPVGRCENHFNGKTYTPNQPDLPIQQQKNLKSHNYSFDSTSIDANGKYSQQDTYLNTALSFSNQIPQLTPTVKRKYHTRPFPTEQPCLACGFIGVIIIGSIRMFSGHYSRKYCAMTSAFQPFVMSPILDYLDAI